MNSKQDNWWGPVVLIMLAAIIGLGGYCLVTGKNITAIDVVITALIMRLGTMMDFRYGSSKGSQEKTVLMADAAKADPVTPDPPVLANAAGPIGFVKPEN